MQCGALSSELWDINCLGLSLPTGERQQFCKSKHRVGRESGVIIIYNIYVECRVDTIYTIYTARSKAYNEKFCIKM